MSKTLEERFWEKIDRSGGEDSCWIFTGAKAKGYGRTGWRDAGGRSVTRSAHRISYELCVGPIPDGVLLDHVCQIRACCNPRHLRPVTAAQNLQNLSGAHRDSRTGVRGVWWDSGRNYFRAAVMVSGRRIYLQYCGYNLQSFIG